LIYPIVRTAIVWLRRDRPSLALSFIMPIAFFSIFAVVFGGRHDAMPRLAVILVDQDQSATSKQLVQALQREGSLLVATRPQSEAKEPEQPEYTASSAEAAIKAGKYTVALIIPAGFGASPIRLRPDPDHPAPTVQILNDASDTIAPQIVAGMLQKAAMTALPSTMAEQGMKATADAIGGFTPQQQARMKANLDQMRKFQAQQAANPAPAASSSGSGGFIAVETRSVVGQDKHDLISFYAAAIGVMFLLFTASGSAGAILDEAESGTLDRVLSSRVSMTGLMSGKLVFNTLLAFTQLTVMFLYAWLVFHVDLPGHIPGFLIMGLSTAVAVAAFGMLLASICHTRAQLGSLSTLLILTMSAIGGSMFPRFLMPENIQKAGLFTINAWAIDGFTKIFWRDLPITALAPQVGVLLAIAVVLFLVARRIARRWEFA